MKQEKRYRCFSPEQAAAMFHDSIEKFGHELIVVPRTENAPCFAYTIGLFKSYDQPEVICFGFSEKQCRKTINTAAELIRKSKGIQINIDYDCMFENRKALFLPVEDRKLDQYFEAALLYYQDIKFPAVQLVWTDRNDRYPWEEQFQEELRWFQPLLGSDANFKF